jgi:hypothetical protein
MKCFLCILAFTASVLGQAPKPAAPAKPDVLTKLANLPENLKKPIELIAKGFPSFDAKKFPKAPATAAYIFRGELGTVDVGFQDGSVVYMVFKVGVGQPGLAQAKAYELHEHYSRELLGEGYRGEKYQAGMVKAINAVIISRSDMDVRALTQGL